MKEIATPTITRCFYRFDAGQRADHAASHRLGHRQREAIGEFYWVTDAVPGIAFPSRKAARAAIAKAKEVQP